MAVEPKRGCGYRKVGGIYIVSGPEAAQCCLGELSLSSCSACGGGIKQSRGWQTIQLGKVIGGRDWTGMEDRCVSCLVYAALRPGVVSGLLWVGAQFYPTVQDFNREAQDLGISRRVAAVPRDLASGAVKIICLAHPTAICCAACGGSGSVEVKPLEPYDARDQGAQQVPCDDCSGKGGRPGVFRVFRPSAIEIIVTESEARDEKAMDRYRARGLTPVAVPDDDRDHNPGQPKAAARPKPEKPGLLRRFFGA